MWSARFAYLQYITITTYLLQHLHHAHERTKREYLNIDVLISVFINHHDLHYVFSIYVLAYWVVGWESNVIEYEVEVGKRKGNSQQNE